MFDIFEIQREMDAGRSSSRQLVSACLERIQALNDPLRAIICTNPDAEKAAFALDHERQSRGPRSSLHGIPVVIKDSIATKDDMPTTAGTRILESFRSSKDAFLVEKLRHAGAVILAKSNLQELSFGFATRSTVGGQTLNPYDLRRQPGGSSGGTAVAVATEMAIVGIGEDTAGSIRVPAAFNSLVGIRPTVGLVSRTGIVPISSTRDTAGPMARTVADAAILLDAIVGYDPLDAATAANVNRIPGSYTNFLNKGGLTGARIGVVRALFGAGNEGAVGVTAVVNAAIESLRQLGATLIDPVDVPYLAEINDREKYPPEWNVEWMPTFNHFLQWAGNDAPFKSFEEFAESAKEQPNLERLFRSTLKRDDAENNLPYLRTIALAQTMAQSGVLQAMAKHNLDALVYPAVQEPPAKIGEPQTGAATTALGARARFPSIVVPAGFTKDGLPVGIEFLARAFEEPRLIELAYAFEQETRYRRPPKPTPE